MALKIRLQRVGKKKQAYFRLILTEHTRKPKGKYLELLGSWNPHQDKISVNSERVNYWLSQGVKPSDTAHNLLVSEGLLKEPKKTVWKPKKKKEETKEPVPTPPMAEGEPENKPEEKPEKKEEEAKPEAEKPKS